MTRPGHVRSLAAPVLVAAAALAILAVLMLAAGYDITESLGAAARGAAGSSYAFYSATLKRAAPLLMLGTAVAIAFRAGVLNIGGEGQFLAGAAAGVAVALAAPVSAPSFIIIPAELSAGILAGALWAGISALLRFRFGVSEVVSTLLLNFVALNGIGFLVRGPLQEPTGAYPQSPMLPASAWLPLVVPGQQLHLGFVFALLVAAATWFVLSGTAAGFRVNVAGTNPSAAANAGLVDVGRVQARALIASGAVAGLAGICQAAGVTHALYEGLSPGYGYVAIGVALLGRLHPLGIVVSAILFGALGAGADAMQRDAGVPAEIASVAAATIILSLLAVPAVRRRLAPQVAGGAA
jgi:simple sugar transport system permease protein